MSQKDLNIIIAENQDIEPVDIVSAALRVNGICAPNDSDFFKGKQSLDLKLEFGKIVGIIGIRPNNDSPFSFDGTNLKYKEKNIILPAPLEAEIDQDSILTASVSNRGWRPDFYFKGRVYENEINPEAVLNINFSQYCNDGCLFCVRTYMQDNPNDYPTITTDHIHKIICAAANQASECNLRGVEQISIVTSIKNVIEHSSKTYGTADTLVHIWRLANNHGFTGTLMYAGYNLSKEDINKITQEIPNFALYFTVECFSHRNKIMPSPKGMMSIDDIGKVLSFAQSKGIKVSYFYIAGIDTLEDMEEGMQQLNFSDLLPNVNLLDVYNKAEKQIRATEFSNEPLGYIIDSIRRIRRIYLDGKNPSRGLLDGSAALWIPFKGVIQLDKAYVLREWDDYKMGPQGHVQFIG